MKDFSFPFIAAKKLLDDYYNAMIAKNYDLAFQIAIDLTQLSVKLEEIAYDANHADAS